MDKQDRTHSRSHIPSSLGNRKTSLTSSSLTRNSMDSRNIIHSTSSMGKRAISRSQWWDNSL
jgi:hypothetical protein